MRGGEDPDNRRNFPGGFLPATGKSPVNAFNPETRTPEEQQTFASIRALLTLRRFIPALQNGEQQILHADRDTLVYARTIQKPGGVSQRVLIAVNRSTESQTRSFDTAGTVLEGMHSTGILIGVPDSLLLSGPKLTLHIASESAIIATAE